MAKKKRVTRKELLKEPDEFMTFTGKLVQYVRDYQKQLMYGFSALVLIIIIMCVMPSAVVDIATAAVRGIM